MRTEQFVRKHDGRRKSLPIDGYMTGGKGAQHWLNKGYVLLKDYTERAPAKNILSALSEKAWEGRRCFVIGGGLSLKGFDFSKLKGALTIGINRAFEKFDPTILFSADPRFWKYQWENTLGTKTLFDKFRGIKLALDKGLVYPSSIKTIQPAGEFSTCLKDGLQMGLNSGYAALNLAVCLGANPIYLLGYDMHDGGAINWHDGYPDKTSNIAYAMYRKRFEQVADRITELGFKVINLNPESALTCFEYGTWDSIVETKRPRIASVIPGKASDIPNKPLSSILPDGAWKGKRCFIVGGGPSIKRFNYSRLKDELVIGVNRAFEKCNPTINFSICDRFYLWIKNNSFGGLDKWRKLTGLKVFEEKGFCGDKEQLHTIKTAGRDALTTSIKDGLGAGLNSGYAALNLAICLGADPIYLLGFDMRAKEDKQVWWHDGYPINNNWENYGKFIEYFDLAAPKIKKLGIRVINLNSKSNLKCFKFGTWRGIKPTNRPLITSHYTKDMYENQVPGFTESCDLFGLEYELDAIDPIGTWRANSNYCVQSIRKMLDKHQRPLLRVDIDARFLRYPSLFEQPDFNADFGAHIRLGQELLGGTVYFNNTEQARIVLDKWQKLCKKEPGLSNQKQLHKIVKEDLGDAVSVSYTHLTLPTILLV